MAKSVSDFRAQHDPATIISGLREELKAAQSLAVNAEAIREILGTTRLQLQTLNPPRWVEKPTASAQAPGVPNLMLSDFHWGERVIASQIGGINSFNLAIARTRLYNVIEKTIYLLKILDPAMRYPGIVVKLGGDMISGNIHEELQATNEINTMPTVMDLYRHLRRGLLRLADVYGSVFVPCVGGNHGRDTKKTWHKDRNHTSFDWLLYQFLAESLADDKRFTFYVPDGADALYKVLNTRLLLTHGDQFKASDSIIGAIGPIMRGTQKKQQAKQAVGQSFDILECGHWHQRIILPHARVNNCLKGYDEYAADNNYRPTPASQNLCTIHADIGVNWDMEVLCDKPRKRAETNWVQIPRR